CLPWPFSLSPAAHEVERGERDDFRRVQEVVNPARFVRLMRELQLARSVRDAVRHARDPRDVLVIVGARAGDETRLSAQHQTDGAVDGRDDRRVVWRPHGIDNHPIAEPVLDTRDPRHRARDNRLDLALYVAEILLDEETPIEHGTAPIGDAWRLDAVH